MACSHLKIPTKPREPKVAEHGAPEPQVPVADEQAKEIKKCRKKLGDKKDAVLELLSDLSEAQLAALKVLIEINMKKMEMNSEA